MGSFAKAWAENPALAEKSLSAFGNQDALSYIGSSNNPELLIKALEAYSKDAKGFVDFVNSYGYDGLGFLKDFPQFKETYPEILPAYSTQVWLKPFMNSF